MTHTVDGFAVDLTADEARAALDAVTEVRFVHHAHGGVDLHILHDGHWYHLCRTDLKDDVCTSWPFEPPTVAFYRARIRYGARLGRPEESLYPEDPPRFAVIDAWSDG